MANAQRSFLMISLANNMDYSDEINKPERYDAFALPDDEFIRQFRLTKSLVRQLCDDLNEELRSSCIRRDVLSVETKVLTALRFFATGSYQQSVANDYLARMSQPSASRCIREVSLAICNVMVHRWISFPDNIHDQAKIKQLFYDISSFPGVIGAIDCTHVALFGINSRNYEPHNFMNRKNYYSINVQIICNVDLSIMNIDARFPGATHDSYIWRSSDLHDEFELGAVVSDGSSWLLGDSGYPLEPWLMTPIHNAANQSPEARYNRSHASARNVVERCNGVLKSRFRCLLKDRTLHYDPLTAARIIIACAVLHNMCIANNIPLYDSLDSSSEDDMFNSGIDSTRARNSQSIRQALVSARFT